MVMSQINNYFSNDTNISNHNINSLDDFIDDTSQNIIDNKLNQKNTETYFNIDYSLINQIPLRYRISSIISSKVMIINYTISLIYSFKTLKKNNCIIDITNNEDLLNFFKNINYQYNFKTHTIQYEISKLYKILENKIKDFNFDFNSLNADKLSICSKFQYDLDEIFSYIFILKDDFEREINFILLESSKLFNKSNDENKENKNYTTIFDFIKDNNDTKSLQKTISYSNLQKFKTNNLLNSESNKLDPESNLKLKPSEKQSKKESCKLENYFNPYLNNSGVEWFYTLLNIFKKYGGIFPTNVFGFFNFFKNNKDVLSQKDYNEVIDIINYILGGFGTKNIKVIAVNFYDWIHRNKSCLDSNSINNFIL